MEKADNFFELSWDKLRLHYNTKDFSFNTTDDVEPLKEILGQRRAFEAIETALNINSKGYNIFITGLAGTGRTTTIKYLLEELSQKYEIPDDICCVNNFKDPDLPRIIMLPPGEGKHLGGDMAEFIESLKKGIPQIFESEEYKLRKRTMLEKYQEKEKQGLRELEKKLTADNFSLIQIQMGPFTRPGIAPVIMGKAVAIEQLENMVEKGEYPRENFQSLKAKYNEFIQEMEKIFNEAQQREKVFKEKLNGLNKELVTPLIKESINLFKDKYKNKALNVYLDEVEKNLMDNFEDFLPQPDKGTTPSLMPIDIIPPQSPKFLEYEINVIVSNSETKGRPVIIENYPTYRNIFGGIERVLDRNGVWRSDYTKIKAGSLIKANGGYLILNLMDALMEPGVWQTLKRALKSESIEIGSFDPFYNLYTSTLKPEPIPLNTKVIILGDNSLYHLLYNLDDDFKKIFKIKSDFDTVMNNDENIPNKYAAFIRSICDKDKLMPFDKEGVAAVVEYGIRIAGRQKKVTTKFHKISDILREANYWSLKDNNSKPVTRSHVEKAIEGQDYRVNMVEEKIQELIEDGILMIDTEGEVVGQVNGLSVYTMGDYSFGRPSKITAKTSMGKAGIINIEREADLSGKTYNKGILILSGYLRYRYAQNKPLTISASICFEQSYSGIDGDSASSSEVFALLSSLSGIPIRQYLAVTGSINQNGGIQPIGGVNEKIEGFFDVCKAKGFYDKQGVIIPKSNLGDLMLKKEVVQSVKEKKFHIYPIETVDQGIEILTGVKAGERGKTGNYPKGSMNFLVDKKLKDLAKGLKGFDKEEKKENGSRKKKTN
jgi:ATP-dependent Lon protease